MSQDTARSVLRLLAVATVLVGAILTTTTVISLIAAGNAMQGGFGGMQVKMTGAVAKLGLFAVLAHAAIMVWGYLLFAMSPSVARMIVSDPPGRAGR